MRSDWPYSAAFVLQLGPGSDPAAGCLEGRLEHVASTRWARFGSTAELMAALAEMLAAANRSDADGAAVEKASDSRSHPPECPL